SISGVARSMGPFAGLRTATMGQSGAAAAMSASQYLRPAEPGVGSGNTYAGTSNRAANLSESRSATAGSGGGAAASSRARAKSTAGLRFRVRSLGSAFAESYPTTPLLVWQTALPDFSG